MNVTASAFTHYCCRSSILALTVLSGLLMACSSQGRSPSQPTPPVPTPDLAQLDARVATLTGTVVTGGVSTIAALEEALALSGIAVRPLNNPVAPASTPAPAQGLALTEDDPEVLAVVQAQNPRVALPDYAASLAALLPGTSGNRIAELMLEDLRTQAQSETLETRAWARFIVELGRQATEPYDLLGSITPAEVQLDMVQRTLIALRLAGDLAHYAHENGAQLPGPNSLKHEPQTTLVPNCTFTGLEGTIIDAAALGLTTGFGSFMGYLDSLGFDQAGKASAVIGLANIIIAYTKVAFSAAMFTIDVNIDAVPVVRTQSRYHEGEGAHTVTAKLTYDFGVGYQYINCLRLALNTLGLDASVPNSGVIEGADVEWKLQALESMQGPRRYRDILQFLAGETVRHAKTNAAGIVTVRFEGLRQREDLGPAPVPVQKQGRVAAITSIKSASVAGDLIDAVGTALGGAVAPIVIIPELFNRMFPLSGSVTFPITDWRAVTNAFVAMDYTDRTWTELDSGSDATGKVVYELLEEVRLPASGEASVRFRGSGSGTYVGTKGPIDEPQFCLGNWSGTWEAGLIFESIETRTDGSIALNLRITPPHDENFAIQMDEDCEVLEYFPWYGDDLGQIIFSPGSTSANLTFENNQNDLSQTTEQVAINFLTFLPGRP